LLLPLHHLEEKQLSGPNAVVRQHTPSERKRRPSARLPPRG
jgi:hypothetical protein